MRAVILPRPVLTPVRLHDALTVAGLATVIYAGKLFYATATVEGLRWVLHPTARLVQWLVGEPFAYEMHYGYVSQTLHFAIVPACAGVNFMLVAFALLTTVLCLGAPLRQRGLGLALAALGAYGATVVVNAGRIAAWIMLREADLAPEALHRVEGVVVYVVTLLVLFELARWARSKLHALA